MTVHRQPIGGVFALEDVSEPIGENTLLQCWSKNAAAVHLFHNARSALNFTLVASAPSRVWLPAYICTAVVSAVPADLPLVYYPIGEALDPDIAFLAARLEPGDAVLGVDYFGRPHASNWREVVRSRTDIVWIEDCAQTLDVGENAFCGLRIHSPRKLLGAPDGGVLVDADGILPIPDLKPLEGDEFAIPYRLRAEDPDGLRHQASFEAFRIAEDSMDVSRETMSDLSQAILDRTQASWITAARRRNYQILFEQLEEYALFPDPPDSWTPLGFPMRCDCADALCAHLSDYKIFVPRHWRTLPSPASDFHTEHELSRSLLTLPCDQRYGDEEMRFMVDLTTAFLR